LTEMDFLTVSVKMAQTFEATTIRGKRGTFITILRFVECCHLLNAVIC
jgi:hypothetical protein